MILTRPLQLQSVWLCAALGWLAVPEALAAGVVQQAYLKASNTGAGDTFGRSVAAFGDTVVVGASWEDSNATGVDGDGSNNSFNAAGAVYVYVRSGSTWSQQAYLKASNTGADDEFGRSVAIFGDTIVVGAPLEDSNATGVGGSQFNNGAGGSGAVYVFVRNGVAWTQQAYLKASNTEAGDDFGRSVAISGDTLVVGAEFEDSSATGVDGNQADNGAVNSGAAYVFVRNGTTWSQQAYLKASNTQAQDSFGVGVGISGDTAVVGAYLEDSNSGAAYVFVRSGTTWSQQAYLKASNAEAGDQFGISVAASGDSIVVGAAGERSNATGVDGDPNDNSLMAAGAAYVFVRSGAAWSQQAYLKASNPAPLSQFGWPVSISADTVLAGAYLEDSSATGVGGDHSNTGASGSGAAYLFVRNGAAWSLQSYIKASNTDAGDHFGISAAVSGDLAVVGAPEEDSSATGVNGDPGNGSSNSGAAYVFDIDVLFAGFCFPGTGGVVSCPCGQPANAAGGCANFGATATSGAVLGASGTPSLSADTLVLETTHHRTAPPGGVLNVFFTGSGTVSRGALSNAGVRCVSTGLRRLYSGNTVAGALSKPGMGDASVSARSSALGVAIAAGQTRHYFNVYRDSSAPGACGSATANTNTTNGGSVTWAP
ncbi:MAG: FG-GAP repeat protein [Planctomycetota bacterium]